MVRLTEQMRQNVKQKLDFTGNNILAWCFYVEKQNTVDYIYKHERLHPANRPKKSIYRHFDYLLLQEFKDKIENMCYSYKIGVDELTVECDPDMLYTIKNWKMKYKTGGKAYEIADAIAYFNEKGHKIKGCIDMDLRETIRKQMEYGLLR